MKSFLAFALLLSCLFFISTGSAEACDTPTVNSFSLAPSAILGDQSEFATGMVQACLPEGTTTLSLWVGGSGYTATKINCGGGEASGYTCNYPGVGPGTVAVTFSTNGYNYTNTDQVGSITVGFIGDPNSLTQAITVHGVGTTNPYETPDQDPDAPCPTCGNAGNPINVLNGNTFIPQRDYFIPGAGGGLTLTRTWNSLWANMNPPEASGIFGDSWRSTFEERIQMLTGGVVKYWKANASSLFYTYNSFSGTYSLTAPADDQTTLSFNSGTSQWTILQKDGTQKIFNSAGYLTNIVDRNGNTITINVDATNQNRIASVTDAAGRVLTFHYTNATFPRLCTSISDSVGTFSQYTYDSSGRLLEVAYPDGSQYNFQYNDPNSNTLISLITDSQGKTIEGHTYDSQRRGKTTQQANDSNGSPVNKVSVQYGYPNAWNNQVCDSTGGNCATVQVSNRAQRHYISLTSDGNGNACSSCEFLGNSSGTIDDSGYRTSSTDGNNKTTFYTYDSEGNTASKSVPDYYTGAWDTWSYTYNAFGEVLTVTDPLGSAGDPNHTTVNAYDGNGNLLSTTSPSPDGGSTPGSATVFTYNSNGTLSTIQDPRGNTTTIAYYPTGLIHTITDVASNVTTYVYDNRGNRTSVTDAASNQTQFQYDSMNRVSKIIFPDSSNVQFGYDFRGRRTSVTDQNGKTTQYAYDDADRLISVTDAQTPTAGVTTYAYDTENDLTDIWDAASHHTRFVYFPGQYLYETVFPSGQSETYQWDGNNNLSSKTDRNGNYISYSYDFQNLLYSKWNYYTGYMINYTHDPAGRLTQVADSGTGSTGTYSFAYDNMGRLTSTTTDYSFDSAGAFTVQYGYDAASNRVSMTDPQSGQTTYVYDTLNRLSSLSYGSQTFGFGYDMLSRRTSLTRPNGVNTSYNYDNLSRLLSVLHASGGTTLDGASYTYDNAVNRTSKTDLLANVTSNYSYDAIYQLLQVTQGTSTTESYTYDPVGNRLSSLGVSPYQYNSSNELTSAPSGSYTYDSNGNMKTKPDGTQYAWDFDNRLTQVTLPSSGGTVTFKYDPFGRRIQKSFTNSLGTTTRNYLYDWFNILQDVDSYGNIVARYVHGPVTDEDLSLARNTSILYYDADGLGSTTSLTDNTGTLTNTYTYDSLGNAVGSTGTQQNYFRYTGRELDSETNLYYYRARYYDPTTGRFVSEDPIRFHGGLNYYRYVFNHSVNYRDPFGLRCDYYQPFDGHYGQPAYPTSNGFPFLPNGFYYYGNWGGPGWTGGSLIPYENMTPDQRSHLAPPIDEQDVCYMHHDVCYANARCNYAGCNKKITQAEGSCDMDLYYCLKGLGNQNTFSLFAQPVFSVLELLK
jgi:RHS repeat-associated protein